MAAGSRNRAGRVRGPAMAAALLLNVGGSLVYTLVVARMAEEPFLSVADVFYLAYQLPLYVALDGLIRARVPRFHPSMWLDGVIGALGTTAVGVAFLIGPYLRADEGGTPLPLVELALPVTDVLLMALLVAVGSIPTGGSPPPSSRPRPLITRTGDRHPDRPAEAAPGGR